LKLFRYLSAASALVLALGHAAAAPVAPAVDYSAANTALLIVDPYNDFMSKGGKLYDSIKGTADASGMFEHLRQIIPAARAAGMQIFILPHHRSLPDGSDYAGWQNVNLFEQKTHGLKAFEVGTWGGEFNPEFGPKKGDVVIREHYAQNGFSNTDLDFELKQHGIRKIILVGVIANSCIEATGRYGMEMGYHVTLVSDAVAAFDEDGMRAAKTNAPMFAHAVMNTSELLAKMPRP